MISFPNCKINLGLNITGKREDGYHNLETVFYPVPLCDVLEIIPLPQKRTNNSKLSAIDFCSSGMSIGGDIEQNLCVKAYRTLKKDFPALPEVKIHLHKIIPMGAGLGGGSANGSFVLKMLNDHFQLGLDAAQLMTYALQLGSDCPFFVINRPCYATGRGEHMEPIEVDFSSFKFVLINPRIHVHTGKAFAMLTPQKPAIPVMTVIQQPVETWKDTLINDFEKPVCTMYPCIAELKQLLYDSGAVYAAMSGSGSTMYGIFRKEAPVQLNLPEKCFYWCEQPS